MQARVKVSCIQLPGFLKKNLEIQVIELVYNITYCHARALVAWPSGCSAFRPSACASKVILRTMIELAHPLKSINEEILYDLRDDDMQLCNMLHTCISVFAHAKRAFLVDYVHAARASPWGYTSLVNVHAGLPA